MFTDTKYEAIQEELLKIELLKKFGGEDRRERRLVLSGVYRELPGLLPGLLHSQEIDDQQVPASLLAIPPPQPQSGHAALPAPGGGAD